ncbi:MAG: (Fe-S)-binding protein, partial [Clostridiales bacterium]|nr:(Fe-S)-binding protein [Clostridiales bacterium]
ASLSEAFRFASKGYDVTVAYDGTLLPEARGLMPDAEIEADIADLFGGVDVAWEPVMHGGASAGGAVSFDGFDKSSPALDEHIECDVASLRSCLGYETTPSSSLSLRSTATTPEMVIEAANEAERCLLCNCSLCIDACTMIRYFKQNPKRIAADLGVTVLPVEGKIQRVASRMIHSCNLCGLCTTVCPVSVDTCEAMESSRHILKDSGHIPPAFHNFWMEDLAFSMSEEAYAVIAPEAKPPLLFFPGCQLAASLPDTVTRTYEAIRKETPGAAMILGCCGVPADWAAETEVFADVTARLRADWEALGKPEVLFACATCQKTFAKTLPEARGRLVYEWLETKETKSDRPLLSPAVVYDPCAAREDASGREAVRALARAAGFDPHEIDAHGEEAACCGFGGHIYPANPRLLGDILKERTEASPLPYITYCANCRDLFLSQGKDSRHILELLFSSPGEMSAAEASAETTDFSQEQILPSLTQRRENRRLLKQRWGTPDIFGLSEPPEANFPVLAISPKLERKMDRLLLLREDIAAAVMHCEQEQAYITDPDGLRTGSFRARVLTVWVTYEVSPDRTFILHNVYTHRMQIDGGSFTAGVSSEAVGVVPEAIVLTCGKCNVPFELIETKFSYLGHVFSHPVPRCPVCGQVHIPESLATGKIAEVETTLEDK